MVENVLTGNITTHTHSQYLLSSSYTAADVLSKLLTVDGPGSGIDADLLDGVQGNLYFTFRGSFTSTSDANNIGDMGMWLNTTGNGTGNSNFPSQYGYIQSFGRGPVNYGKWQMSVDDTADNIHVRAEWAGTWGGWKKLWHSANSNLKTVDWAAKNMNCVNGYADGAVVAKYLSSSYATDWPIGSATVLGTFKAGLSLIANAGVLDQRNRHYTTVTSYTDAAARDITAKIALGTGNMTSGTLDQIKLDFAPLTTTFGLTANVIVTQTGAGAGLIVSFREDSGTGRWYICIYNPTGATVVRDGIYLSISGKQTV